ncbi:MAG: triphosphoribosyl-dephospho-CoA synthase, partial [Thermoleophilaceae bacterium]
MTGDATIASLVREAVLASCRLDVLAFKPGNVSLPSPGHGMTATDFLTSTEAVAPILSATGLSLGRRVLMSVEATRRAVGCNTNLG